MVNCCLVVYFVGSGDYVAFLDCDSCLFECCGFVGSYCDCLWLLWFWFGAWCSLLGLNVDVCFWFVVCDLCCLGCSCCIGCG